MHYDYRVYGLTLRANHWLPHLVANPDTSVPDVRIELGCACGNAHAARLRFADERGALGFAISSDGRQVWCDWTGTSDVPTIDDVAAMLAGPVFGCVLRLRGEISLHASVVDLGGQAIVIVGGQGSGKSTTAAALADAGHSVLSDDVAAVTQADATWVVHPGYPRVRLAPASAQALGLASAGLPAVMSGGDKYHVRLVRGGDAPGWRFGSGPLKVAAVYVLDRRRDTGSAWIELVPGAERLATLMRNRSAQRLLRLDRRRQAQEFAGLARLAAELPVRRINYPDSLQSLGVLPDLLLDDLAACC